VFVAVEIDAGVARRIADFGEELRRRVQALAPRARVSWVRPEQLHITVRFLGEVDEPRARATAAALAPRLATGRFRLALAGAGAFPLAGSPRVLWVGITTGAETMMELERQVGARLEACGFAPENRPYRPHVTLARVRKAAGLRTASLMEGLTDRKFGSSTVDTITLFQSQASPQGSIYIPLQRSSLGA
jgi:2'-5' RNA ligase